MTYRIGRPGVDDDRKWADVKHMFSREERLALKGTRRNNDTEPPVTLPPERSDDL